jgi:uncharacterized membrane protein
MLPRATIATVVALLAPASDTVLAVALGPIFLDSPQLMIPLALAVLIVAGGGALVLYTRLFAGARTDDGSTTEGPATVDGSAVDTESVTRAQQRTPVPEQLSDEDRVIQLLEENGGRMKQVNIVDNTEWSKSKVSMLLSDMEDDGEISKLRVGRENIISLAGEEPDAAGSPFEE